MGSIQEELQRATSGGDSLQPDCIYAKVFSAAHKTYLNDTMLLASLLTAASTTWVLYHWGNLQLKNFINECSYNNLFNYLVAVHLRLIIPFTISFVNDFFEIGILSHEFSAFLETFLQVLEIEALTHLCIERYVYAKYITNGWQINRNQYTLYIYLCFMFAGLYSIPPLYGVGDYGFDFTCDTYTMDMVLPNSWKRYVIITLFALKTVKPMLVTAAMLRWARKLEANYTNQMKKRGDLQYTQLVIRIAMWNYGMWIPMAFVRGLVLLSQLVWGQMILPPSDAVRWAFWMYQVSPLTVTIMILLDEARVRDRASDYDETRTEHKKD